MKMPSKSSTVVPREGEEPLPVKIIEDAIVEIAAGMRAINNTRLTRKAVVVLLHDYSKLAKRDIEAVLDAMENLEAAYLKKASR